VNVHAQARAVLAQVSPSLTPAESLAVRCVAWHETNYSRGWTGEGAGSHNWGAVTKAMPCDAATGFLHRDSRPDPERPGEVLHYTTCFRRYPSAEAGAADVARHVLKANVREAIAKGQGLRGVAEEMYRNGYYTGTSHNPETNIQRYTTALEKAKRVITAATGEADTLRTSSHMLALASCLIILAIGMRRMKS
jgi:hypothetical protein